MQCEMCGSNKAIYEVRVEGAMLNLCQDCSSYGTVVEKIKPKPKIEKKKQVIKKETIFVIRSDYSEKIKNAREKRGLKQDELANKINEKTSLISKLETGSIEPSIRLARKLESFLKLNLVEEETMKKVQTKHEETVTTIGDLIKIK